MLEREVPANPLDHSRRGSMPSSCKCAQACSVDSLARMSVAYSPHTFLQRCCPIMSPQYLFLPLLVLDAQSSGVHVAWFIRGPSQMGDRIESGPIIRYPIFSNDPPLSAASGYFDLMVEASSRSFHGSWVKVLVRVCFFQASIKGTQTDWLGTSRTQSERHIQNRSTPNTS